MNSAYNRLRLGLNIRMRRHILKMTQAQLAEKVGCTNRAISALERGKRDLSVEMLFSLCRALECSAADILQNVD